jgi:hypothetical protein
MGKYAQFDGTGYITVPNDDALNLGAGDFSIAFWLKTADTTFILAQKGSTVFWRIRAALGVFYIDLNGADSSAWSYSFPVAMISDNAWHLVVVTKSSAGIACHIDGSPVTMTQHSKTGSPNVDNSDVLYISGTGAGFLTGSLDNFCIFKRALQTSDIASLYGDGRGRPINTSMSGFSWGMDFGKSDGSVIQGFKAGI